MKAMRLAEVLLPLLAARAWAPWAVEPRHSQRQRVHSPLLAASSTMSWRDHQYRHRPFDDLQ